MVSRTSTPPPAGGPRQQSGPPGLPYSPALDGLRGLCVLAVMLFHAGFGWAIGGYLGVSTFFTLSGFLITSLLFGERHGTGSIDLRRFWSRRFRRLMPAALATLGLAVLFGATVADPGQLRDLRGDVLAALAYVANWRFILDDQSYADLFAGPSPVLHFWSLAIEEQFYMLFPLVTAGVLGVAGGSRRRLASVLAVGAALSFALPLLFDWSRNRIYFGTDTRAVELLIGSLVGLLLYRRRIPRSARPVVALTGVGGLALMVWLMATTTQGSGWLYDGGLGLYAGISAMVIVSAVQPWSPVSRLLARRPLVGLGRISYGVYLYHWLVYLWLTPERTGLALWPLFGLRALLTLAAATASYRLLEEPIRRARLVTAHQARRLVPAAAIGLAVALVVVTTHPPEPLIDFAAAEEALAATEIAPMDHPPTGDPAGDLPAPPPPRIAMFGDSTALMTAVGLTSWMEKTGAAVNAGGNSWLGCGVGRGGERRAFPGDDSSAPDGCDDWETTWAAAIDEGSPDLAVVQVGPWEVADRRLPGDDEWRAPGDPTYDRYLLEEMVTATDVLSAGGAEVVWLTSPPVGPGTSGNEIERRGDAADPARMQRVNELMTEAAERRPGTAHVLDLAGYVASTGEDVRLRPDGVHFGPETAEEVVRDWLGASLVEIHVAEWIDRWLETNAPPLPSPLRTLMIGDSTAMMVGFGLDDYGRDTGELQMRSLAELGCGVGRGGWRDYQAAVTSVDDECAQTWEGWRQGVEEFDPDVVVALTGPFDVCDRRLDGSDEWQAPGDPEYDAYLSDELEAASELLTSRGALLVWLTSPAIDLGRADVSPGSVHHPASDPDRMDRLNELIQETAEGQSAIATADYAAHLRSYPGGELDPEMRPDGVHLANGKTRLVADWLAPELERLYAEREIEIWRSTSLATLLGAP